MADWHFYQEEVAEVFKALGCEVQTNCKCLGARTTHSLDVSVRFDRFGLLQHWIVECKHWKLRRVSKDKVITLKGIVDDLGADRGVLIAESGHQAGAHRYTSFNNITLTSLRELREKVAKELYELGFAQARRRAATIKEEIPSLYEEVREGWLTRITPKSGTDGQVMSEMFFIASTIQTGAEKVELNAYPIELFSYGSHPAGYAKSLGDFVEHTSKLLDEMEPKLKEQKGCAATLAP